MKRFAGAFTAEWLPGGGSAAAQRSVRVVAGNDDAMRREFCRKPPAAALLAIDGNERHAGQALSRNRARVRERARLRARDVATPLRDLDGLTVVEIPWIVTPDAPRIREASARREFASAALTRLYALGLDAFRVAQAFKDGPPERFSLEGATGQIALGDGRQFTREGRFAVFAPASWCPLDGAR